MTELFRRGIVLNLHGWIFLCSMWLLVDGFVVF